MTRRFRIRRAFNNFRCHYLNRHTWHAYRSAGDGVNVLPHDPRTPKLGAHRKCTWCGHREHVSLRFDRRGCVREYWTVPR